MAERALRECMVVGSIPAGGFPREAPSHLLSRSLGGLEGHKARVVGIEPRAALTLNGRDAATPGALPQLAAICWRQRLLSAFEISRSWRFLLRRALGQVL